MTAERNVKANVFDAFGLRPDLLLWNNPTGIAKALSGEHMIRFGLKGSADILGLRALLIDEAMVGLTIGQAVAIETKRSRGGEHSEQQQRFAAAFRARGGLYILAPSVEHVRRALG